MTWKRLLTWQNGSKSSKSTSLASNARDYIYYTYHWWSVHVRVCMCVCVCLKFHSVIRQLWGFAFCSLADSMLTDWKHSTGNIINDWETELFVLNLTMTREQMKECVYWTHRHLDPTGLTFFSVPFMLVCRSRHSARAENNCVLSVMAAW